MTLAPVAAGSTLATWAEQLAPARQLAEIVASTDFVPTALRGNPDACCACIMYGLAIGAEPMVALQSIHVVEGRPQPSAELMRAMILRDGHTLTVHTATGEHCRVSGLRRGADPAERVTVEWTLEMARKAGLLNRQNWQRYPRAMLLARATSELARIAFPDAIKGLGQISEDSAPEALEAWANTAAESEPEAPPKRAVRRRPRQVAGRAVETVALPEVAPDGSPEPGHPPWSGQLDPWAEPAAPRAESPQRAPHAPQDRPAAPDSAGPAEPEPQPAAIGDALRAALMAQTSRLGVDPSRDRDQRLALWSALLGRRVGSTLGLSRAEGLTLMGRMAEVETGAVEADYSVETGAYVLRRIESEPPPDEH